jgi:hypothetical protein
MKDGYPLTKTKISFSIVSDDLTIDPVSITETLQLMPSRFHRKGDTFTSKHSGSLCTNLRTVWAIDSEWMIHKDGNDDETLSHNYEYLKEILLPKAEILKRYKIDDRYELGFWITIITEDAGFSLDLTQDELNFFNEFSNRLIVSMTAGLEL